jgi:hypothetical protein
MPSSRIRLGVALVLMGLPSRAWAQDTARDPATAQALFDDAKRLMQAGKYAEACPKFAESQRLDPAGGTLIALALCHEGEGRTATAWGEFVDALAEARKDKRADREAAAQEHIKRLEPRLVRMRIVVTKETPGLELRRDGVVIGSAQWSTAVPIDPGQHAFEARAPKKKTWSALLAIEGEGKTIDVPIPALADEAEVAVVAPPPPPVRQPPPKDDTHEPASDGSTQRVLGLAAGGAGIVLTGIGVGLGLSASSKWKDADKACPGGKCTTPAQIQAGKDAGSTADAATVFYVVGGIALASGVALYLTAPSGKSSGTRIAPWVAKDGAGVGVGGSL